MLEQVRGVEIGRRQFIGGSASIAESSMEVVRPEPPRLAAFREGTEANAGPKPRERGFLLAASGELSGLVSSEQAARGYRAAELGEGGESPLPSPVLRYLARYTHLVDAIAPIDIGLLPPAH